MQDALTYGMQVNGKAAGHAPPTTHQFPTNMERTAFIAQVAETFKSNASVEKYFVTKDAQCFLREHDARNHEKYLGVHDRGVECITRESIERHLRGEKAAKPSGKQGTGEEQGGEGSGTDAAASDKSTGATADEGGENTVADARKALEEEVADKAAADAAAPKKAAAKKAAPKKAAAKKSAKKK